MKVSPGQIEVPLYSYNAFWPTAEKVPLISIPAEGTKICAKDAIAKFEKKKKTIAINKSATSIFEL